MNPLDSLWTHEIVDLRKSYAAWATNQYLEDKCTSENFIKALQSVSDDTALLSGMVQASKKAVPRKRKRGERDLPHSFFKATAELIAKSLLSERPKAKRKEVERRVYEIMNINGGDFIHGTRTVEIWLEQFFRERGKR